MNERRLRAQGSLRVLTYDTKSSQNKSHARTYRHGGCGTVDVAAPHHVGLENTPPPPHWQQVLERSGVLSEAAGAFFYDQDLKLIDTLADGEVTMPSPSFSRPDSMSALLLNSTTPRVACIDRAVFPVHHSLDELAQY